MSFFDDDNINSKVLWCCMWITMIYSFDLLYTRINNILILSTICADSICLFFWFVFLLLITIYTQWFYINWNSNFRFIYTYYIKKVPRNRNYYLQLQHAFLKNLFVAFHSTSLEYSTANGLWWRKITKAIRYLLNEERVFTTFPGFRAQSKPPAAS